MGDAEEATVERAESEASMRDEVIVIGGGIVGASAAYRLARAGARVTLVDRADVGQATAAGAGILAPGANTSASPAWLALAFRSAIYYEELLAALAEDGETDTGYDVPGLLLVATSDDEAQRLPDITRLLQERSASGVRNLGAVSLIGGDEARQLFPPLGEVAGAVHVPGAARMDGRRMRDALARAARRRGAELRAGTVELVMEGARAVGVDVDGQRIAAGAVLLAGGAWSSAVADALGVLLPVYPQRGQILHLEMPGAATGGWPIVEGFHSHYMLSFPPHRVVAGATRENDAGFDYRQTAGGVHEALGQALRIAPGLASATLREVRIGFRPASPDGLPMLGRLPGTENVYAATGHGPSGLLMGPYSGAAVADLVCGATVDIDLSPYDPERFQ